MRGVSGNGWTFVTSHAVLLVEVARAPDSTVRELAARAGLTERQAHRVLADLVEEGYLDRERVGRRNHYRVNAAQPMRHPSVRAQKIGDLLDVLKGT
jgi:DNA-binding MarR family transcriptional regulator